jgi:hypothetical protein
LRYWSGLTTSIQALLVLLLSVIAVIAFSNSFVFSYLVSAISQLKAFEPIHISMILAGILILIGSLQVIVRRTPDVGFFMFFVVILLIPSVLATTNINWIQIMGWQLDTELELPRSLVFLFIALVIIGYIVLRISMQADSSALAASSLGFNKEEINIAFFKQHAWSLTIISGTAAIVLVIYLITNYVDSVLRAEYTRISVDILLVGILCVLVFIAVVYITLVRGRLPLKIRQTSEPRRISPDVAGEQIYQTERARLRITLAPSPWFCPNCGSDSTRQYQVLSVVHIQEEEIEKRVWESQCKSCGSTWRWSNSNVGESTDEVQSNTHEKED